MSGNFLPFLADRVLNRPLLLEPGKAETILSVLEGRISIGEVSATTDTPAPSAARFKGGFSSADGTPTKFTRVSANTALVSVVGSLVNRGAWVGASSGLVSYEGIAAQLDEIEGNKAITHVVLDLDSYGGEATGMVGLAAKIRNLRRSKRVTAVINDVAASAGYGIASAAHEIVVSPTSLVGSIGVVMLHIDRSGEMHSRGLRPTFIHAGAKKVDGHAFGPLPDSVRADMQRDVAAIYDQFLSAVEQGRGKSRLSADKARKTEADVFMGQAAIDAGLADRMATLDEILSEATRPAGNTSRKGSKMDHNISAGDVTDTSLKAARIEGEAAGKIVGKAEGHAEGVTAGANQERARIAAIMALPEAEKRQASALKLALDPAGLSAETAKGILAGLPEEGGAAPAAASAPTTPTIESRAPAQEIGATTPTQAQPEAATAGWNKAVAKVNATARV